MEYCEKKMSHFGPGSGIVYTVLRSFLVSDVKNFCL